MQAPSFMVILEIVMKVIIALVLIAVVIGASLVTVDQFIWSFTG